MLKQLSTNKSLKNQENFDETTKNVNAYDRKNSKNNSGYSRTEP